MWPYRQISELLFLLACQAYPARKRNDGSRKKPSGRNSHQAILLVLVTAILAVLSAQVRAQSLSSSEAPSATAEVTARGEFDLTYVRPTQRTKVSNYAFDAFGPYPIAGATFAAVINQFSNAPPEWNQGLQDFGKRFGSEFAIAAVATTSRYGLAAAFKEDTLYYRCRCAGPYPRLRHAVISTLTGRRGEDGHRVFSFSALFAPYVGSATAVYGWYPNRFGAKDAFRMGNYSLLRYVGGNIALEFFYSGPHSLLSHMHLNNTHGSPIQGQTHE
jgi:hypothetical protein